MKENKKMFGLLLILSLLTGGYVIFFYWSSADVDGIMKLPMDAIACLFGYVLLQIAKRQLFNDRKWWDWLYYIGLLTAVLPTFFANAGNGNTFLLLAQIGALFLIIPVLLDGKSWINDKK